MSTARSRGTSTLFFVSITKMTGCVKVLKLAGLVEPSASLRGPNGPTGDAHILVT